MKILQIVILASIFLLISCGKSYEVGGCGSEEHVKFRNLTFNFPLSANKINLFGKNHVEHGFENAITDSLVSGTSVIWHYNTRSHRTDSMGEKNLPLDSLSVYGVTFNLFADSDKSEQAIIQELQRNYPGEYVFHNAFDIPHYEYSKGCLRIILRRESYSFSSRHAAKFSITRTGSAPVVSFCYGLTDKQAENYVRNSGNIYTEN
ncbi:hypothetical protein [Dyadobacter psychrotolerans]|uniref:Lipoprotein n=1 Tax=Dyadobacter psychrotolerans TaxID=2541721 RepID=A0A4R5DM50_9BACT|nr:hypothetical protein [Dyadobacter psychrotolerans]TDE14547.1 hypothetical protein E0F88_15240 [Dyadobacter psychrotolerans]